jgi:hypothetical protein
MPQALQTFEIKKAKGVYSLSLLFSNGGGAGIRLTGEVQFLAI